MAWPSLEEFVACVEAARYESPDATLVVPMSVRLLEDQLTPVLAYRRLVAPDKRTAPSFLLESVEGGERQGRHSILGAQPALEVIVRGHDVQIVDHRSAQRWHPVERPPGSSGITHSRETDPLDVPRRLSANLRLTVPVPTAERAAPLPSCVLGGWFGYASYDSVRYAEPEKLGFTADPSRRVPDDDRRLPEIQFAYYDGTVVFDHVDKLVYVVCLVEVPVGAGATDPADLRRLHEQGLAALEHRVQMLQTHSKPLPSGRLPPRPQAASSHDRATLDRRAALDSNLTPARHAEMVAKALEYIRAGDVFQVVLGQRFEKRSHADPFDVYRALRAVNPSPYMVYLQAQGCILVASSPEILCRVRRASASTDPGARQARLVVTNRPLAGTRRRGSTPDEDAALERELLADPKERAEHIMLVDLGRNDVGKVARPGSIELPVLMSVERYSHVMHISSTVTGELRRGLDCWDALRAALPVGTISGAPKVRAMQIIDELEPVRRGPYGGGFGYVSLDGEMDIALALRTMVVPTAARDPSGWMYHLQASGGIVADSQAPAEYQETVNKAAALARAIEVAESAFTSPGIPA
ncbi:MAG: chorismate-binding protein [Phycisphaerales bacterium]